MSSNIILLVCVISGFLVGYITKRVTKFQSYILNITIIVLLFIMGALLGSAPDLPNRLLNYGISAFVITLFAMIFSVLAVYLAIKIYFKVRKCQ